jgi:hypothetical protein
MEKSEGVYDAIVIGALGSITGNTINCIKSTLRIGEKRLEGILREINITLVRETVKFGITQPY